MFIYFHTYIYITYHYIKHTITNVNSIIVCNYVFEANIFELLLYFLVQCHVENYGPIETASDYWIYSMSLIRALS